MDDAKRDALFASIIAGLALVEANLVDCQSLLRGEPTRRNDAEREAEQAKWYAEQRAME